MNCVSDDLFAHAAFAFNQDGRTAACSLGGNGKRTAECRCTADDFFKTQRMRYFFGQRLQFAEIFGVICGHAQRGDQALCRHGFDDIIRRTRPHRFNRCIIGPDSGQQQYGQCRAAGLEFGNQHRAVCAWHPLVNQDCVQHHAILCAKHGNGGFCVTRKNRAPSGPPSNS